MRGQTNYPSAVREAEQVVRDYQGISGDGVTIPTWLFAGGIGLLMGVVFGPTITTSAAFGSAKLGRMTASRIGA